MQSISIACQVLYPRLFKVFPWGIAASQKLKAFLFSFRNSILIYVCINWWNKNHALLIQKFTKQHTEQNTNIFL